MLPRNDSGASGEFPRDGSGVSQVLFKAAIKSDKWVSLEAEASLKICQNYHDSA